MKIKQKCTICNDEVDMVYNPMKEWRLDGILCGDCYSKQLADFYPGDHVRMNDD
ncbi:MAG: hypothetical protein ACE5RI_09265 [Candidatus Nitrosomaritimum yanchengensis]